MTDKRPNPATEAVPGSPSPIDTDSGGQFAAQSITAEVPLASYVETLASDDFTVAARAAVLSEIKEFAAELCDRTKTFQQLDGEAENALRKHVLEASRSMRQSKQAKDSKGSDWCKWVGFAFLAFMVQQFNRVAGEKVILRGSVNWLLADTIITLVLLVTGFVIEKPFAAATRVFRRKK